MVAEVREQIRWKRNIPRPLDLIVEVGIFILVFLVSGLLLQGILAAIGMLLLALTNREFVKAFMYTVMGAGTSVNLADSAALTDQLMQTPGMVLVALFSTLGLIAGTLIYCRAIEGRRLATLGFRRGHALREYLAGAFIGFALLSLAVLICVLAGALNYEGLVLGSVGLLVLLLLGFLVQGLSEEVLCRGYFMVSLARRQSLVAAVLVSSCFFGALHIFNSSVQPLAILNTVLFGCVAAVYLLKRGDIWGAAAIHSLWNFAQGNIYGISVSGMEKMESVLNFTPVAGGELISGGDYGIEGGLAATIVLAIALIVALLLKSRDPASDASMEQRL
jgi:membrane protease YdiL (CAAX protease family)